MRYKRLTPSSVVAVLTCILSTAKLCGMVGAGNEIGTSGGGVDNLPALPTEIFYPHPIGEHWSGSISDLRIEGPLNAEELIEENPAYQGIKKQRYDLPYGATYLTDDVPLLAGGIYEYSYTLTDPYISSYGGEQIALIGFLGGPASVEAGPVVEVLEDLTKKLSPEDNYIGARVRLLKVDVEVPELDSDGSETGNFISASELKVGKMEGAVDSNGIRIGDDVDRFRVRIPGLGATTASVKIETIDNPDYEIAFNDEPDEIMLSAAPDGNGFVSDWMLLVSGNIDDAETRVNVGVDNEDGDKTHQVQIGGELKISELKINDSTYSLDARKEVKIKKKLDVVLVNLVDEGLISSDTPTLDASDIDTIKVHMIRRFAQVGVKVNFEIVAVTETEAGIDLAMPGDGLDGQMPDDGDHIGVTDEIFDVIDHLSSSGIYNSDKIFIVFAPRLDEGLYPTPRAFAITESIHHPSLPGPFVMVSWNDVDGDRYTIAHETLHVLLDASHDYSGGSSAAAGISKYQSDFNDKRTVWGGTNNNASVEASRRIYREMSEELLQSPYIRNP